MAIKEQIDKNRLPKHIAIIMDGNGRWAKQHGKNRIFGHKQGAKTVKEIVKISGEIQLEYLTLYAFSTENWNRPKSEVTGLMELLVTFLRKEIEELHTNNVKIKFIGDIDNLPQLQKNEVYSAMKKTKDNTGLMFIIALNYGSRMEIIEACKSIASKVKNGKLKLENIDEDIFSKNLFTKDIPDPDLLIRTSGEQRLSNFLLYQLAYSEFYFTDVYWPDFDVMELEKAIDVYLGRDRRFGGI